MGHRRRTLRAGTVLATLTASLWGLTGAIVTPEGALARIALVATLGITALGLVLLAALRDDPPLALLGAGLPLALALAALPDEAAAWMLAAPAVVVTCGLVLLVLLLAMLWGASPATSQPGVEVDDDVVDRASSPLAGRRTRRLRDALLLLHLATGPVVILVRQAMPPIDDVPGGHHPLLALLLTSLFSLVVIPPLAFSSTPPAIDARLLRRSLLASSRTFRQVRIAVTLAAACLMLAGWASVRGLW